MKTRYQSLHIQWSWLLGGILLLIILTANTVATHNMLTHPYPGLNDFMSRWEGARSFFEDGLNPYGDEATLNIQERIYGRAAIEGEDPGLFVYPFYTVFTIWPLAYMDYAWASAIWMVMLEICLIASLFLLLNLFNWRPTPLILLSLTLWTIFNYFAARGLVLGQPGHLVYFLQVLSLWALYKKQDNVAGISLAISTLKPQMGYLFVPFLLFWAIRAKRTRFVMAFCLSFATLLIASFILQPTWFGDWIEQVRQYPQYTAETYPDTGSPVWIITHHYLGLGTTIEWVINLLFMLLMLWAWYDVLVKNHTERFLWTVVLTLTVTHMIALRTATPHFVIFNIALIFYLKELWKKSGNRAVIAGLLLLFVFFWLQFLITVQGRDTKEHPVLFLVVPFAVLILHWRTRKLWWESAPAITRPSPSG